METTSRNYYEDKIREFRQHRRGRTLQQFCRDEGIDYKWMLRAKKQYDNPDNKVTDATDDNCPTLIQLHYEDCDTCRDKADEPASNSLQRDGGWTVGCLRLTDPSGNDIIISSGSVAALGNLLTKLASCHD